MSIKSDIEDYFKDVVFTVDANSFEQHALWMMYHYKDVGYGQVLRWEEESRGHGITIGHVKDMPVVLSLNYARIEGRRVCFFYGCSQVVDYRMVDKWMDDRTGDIRCDNGYRPATCDAMNFSHCLAAIREMNR